MSQSNNRSRPSRRGNRYEQPKNLGKSFRRIIKELGSLKNLLFIAIGFAILSSVLSIIGPSKISKLTDEIASGLRIDSDKLELISKDIQINLLSGNPTEIEFEGQKISLEDQLKYAESFKNLQNQQEEMTDENREKLIKAYENIPESIKSIVEPSINMEYVKRIAIFLLGLYLLSGLFNYLKSRIMVELSNNFARKLRIDVSEKINRLPLKYVDSHQIGDILSRITNDVDSIAGNLNQSLGTLALSSTMIIGSSIMMFYTNWMLALVAIGSSVFGFIFMFLILSKSQNFFRQRQKQLGKINGFIEEIYSGISIIKAYNAEEDAHKEFKELNNTMFRADIMSKFLSGMMQPIMNFIGNLGYVSVSIVGAVLARNGTISFGVIVAFMTYVRMFTNPLSQIAQAMQALQSSAAASERVFEFMDEEELPDESNLSEYINPNKANGKIEFKNVSFRYPSNHEDTIIDFSAVANPGDKVAIVGPTGAGKSTMVNLLMKFYDITGGDILIDGISIKELKRKNIRELFTMVLQDTWLFEGTIRENIVYNMEGVTEEELDTLMKYVGLNHFINTLPDGMDTVIKDEESVSAGQRQLLTIARGMLKDAPFLILDEATSNVDTRTEKVVQSAMDKLMLGKTSFVIAHRLSTIINSDLIIVMNEGNIIEQGTHDELMSKNGFYADLYNSQFTVNA